MAALSAAWLYLMHINLEIKGTQLPQLAGFFSPQKGFWQNAYSMDSKMNMELKHPKYKGEIYLDDRMVPHIYAEKTEDAYFLQGYIHAYFRLWQMDFSTRAAEGRISELIGEKALEFDKNKRRKGISRSARNSVEVWKKYPQSYALCEAYADGINYFIEGMSEKDLPIEYKLMGFKPEKWTPYKSALFHKSMAEVLCGREWDVEMTNAKAFFGEEFNRLFPEFSKDQSPVIPKETKWSFSLDSMKGINGDAMDIGFLEQHREPGISGLGSNNWAVNGSKAAAGNPLLCNDPHLTLTLPNIWFEQQMITPAFNVYGVTFAGIPGVVIGFNQNIAWGVTNGGWDVMDWYKIEWKDEKKQQYKLDGEWKNTELVIENIKVKGKEDVIDTVRWTVWGPIVFTQPSQSKFDLAMHWIVNEPSQYCEMDVFTDLNKAKNFSDYRNAIKKFPYPAQNFAFMSKDGEIALTVQGNMPIKNFQQGRFVLDGSDSKNAWHGFIPSEFNPYTHNPSRGFISSANQKSTDESYPNYYNDGDFRDFRGIMVNRLLENENQWTVDKMKKMQFNNYSLKAELELPSFFGCVDTTVGSPAYMLAKWDRNYDSNSVAPVYFDLWSDYFHKLVWDEIYQDTTKKFVAVPNDQNTIELMKANSNHIYFDLVNSPQKESACDIVKLAWDSTLQYLTKHPGLHSWGEFKDAAIPHMARIPAFGKYHLSCSGNADIINAAAKTFGPSWRMVVEHQKDGVNAYGIYPGGQSGHPGSQYYDQMIEDWRLGNHYALEYDTDVAMRQKKYVYSIKLNSK